MASRIEAVNEVLQEQLGSWEPDSATDTKEMLEALPGLFENLGNVLSTMAERLGDHAVEPAVTEELREAAAGADGQREAFENVYKTFRATHEHDLQRLEEPRPGEKDWDVTQNE